MVFRALFVSVLGRTIMVFIHFLCVFRGPCDCGFLLFTLRLCLIWALWLWFFLPTFVPCDYVLLHFVRICFGPWDYDIFTFRLFVSDVGRVIVDCGFLLFVCVFCGTCDVVFPHFVCVFCGPYDCGFLRFVCVFCGSAFVSSVGSVIVIFYASLVSSVSRVIVVFLHSVCVCFGPCGFCNTLPCFQLPLQLLLRM